MIQSSGKLRGFTLIEFAAVMVISGLLMIAGFSIYNQYLIQERALDAFRRQQLIATSLSSFVASLATKTGARLPCPADPTLPMTDLNAGMELPGATAPGGVCYDLIYTDPMGTCRKFDGTAGTTGVCKVAGRDTSADPDSSPDPVLIGVVPYASIKIGLGLSQGWKITSGTGPGVVKECINIVDGITEEYCDADSDGAVDSGKRVKPMAVRVTDTAALDMLDPWRYQMTYAVSGYQAGVNYDAQHGAIDIQTETGRPLVKPVGSAHYALVAHGDNHMGAYNVSGQLLVPCTTGNLSVDEKNCDGDSVFVSGIRSIADNANYSDDTVYHAVINVSKLWEFSGTEDIYNLNPGNVGIGTDTPTAKLDVAGNLKAQKTHATQLCDAGGANCWSPDVLAGSSADNLGTLCDSTTVPPAAGKGRVAIGIRNGQIYCSKNPADPSYDPSPLVYDASGNWVSGTGDVADPDLPSPPLGLTCTTSGQYLAGYSAAGTPICCTLGSNSSCP